MRYICFHEDDKYNSCATSVFNEAHIFREEYSFLIYTEKRKEEKSELKQSWRHEIQVMCLKVVCLIDNSKY